MFYPITLLRFEKCANRWRPRMEYKMGAALRLLLALLKTHFHLLPLMRDWLASKAQLETIEYPFREAVTRQLPSYFPNPSQRKALPCARGC